MNTTNQPEPKSACCGAFMFIAGYGETHWYICTSCKKACDPKPLVADIRPPEAPKPSCADSKCRQHHPHATTCDCMECQSNRITPAKEGKEDWKKEFNDLLAAYSGAASTDNYRAIKDFVSNLQIRAITNYVEEIKGILEESKVDYDVDDCDCKAGKTKSFNEGIEVAITLLTYHGK